MSSAETFLLFLRVGFSLAIVLAMIWGVARYAKRRGKLRVRGQDAHVDLVARRQLGRRGSLVVVEAAGRTLLVGVTDANVSLVADLTDGARPAASLGEAIEVDAGARVTEPVVLDAVEAGLDLRTPREPVGHGRRGESLLDALRDMTVRRI